MEKTSMLSNQRETWFKKSAFEGGRPFEGAPFRGALIQKSAFQ